MRVGALYIYPVKACRALALEDAVLGPLGLEHDRRFAFVHPDGRALTQREQPLLATVRPSLGERSLRLDFGGLLELLIPLQAFAESAAADVWEIGSQRTRRPKVWWLKRAIISALQCGSWPSTRRHNAHSSIRRPCW